MLRIANPLLRPGLDRLIIEDCEDRQLLNPGKLHCVKHDDSGPPEADRRELLSARP